jgi:hypothetical protein
MDVASGGQGTAQRQPWSASGSTELAERPVEPPNIRCTRLGGAGPFAPVARMVWLGVVGLYPLSPTGELLVRRRGGKSSYGDRTSASCFVLAQALWICVIVSLKIQSIHVGNSPN